MGRAGLILFVCMAGFVLGMTSGVFLAKSGAGLLWGPVHSLEDEVRVSLGLRLNELAALRNGDPAAALESLERAAFAAALTLPQGKPFASLEPGLQETLQRARLYFAAYPPGGSLPVGALDGIPLPPADHKFRNPAWSSLLERVYENS